MSSAAAEDLASTEVSSDEFSALAEILASTSAHEMPVSVRGELPDESHRALLRQPVDRKLIRTSRPELSALADILTSAVRTDPATSMLLSPGHPRPAQERANGHGFSSATEFSEHDAAALRVVGRSLAAVESCITLQAHSTGLLMPLAVRHVLRAEMARATCLLQLLRFLKNDLSLAMNAVASDTLVERVLQATESERGLRRISLTPGPAVRGVSVVADEGLLSSLLLGAVLTTFGLMDAIENPQVQLVVSECDGGQLSMTITQAQIAPPAGWPDHDAAETPTDAEGSVFQTISLKAGELMAQAWGGRFSAVSADRSTSISISLPFV